MHRQRFHGEYSPLSVSAVGLALVLGACASGPYPRSALHSDSRTRPARALVRYLGQPNADPAACRPGPEAVAWVDADVAAAVAGAIEDGDVAPDVGAVCLDLVLDAVRPNRRAEAIDEVADAYVRVLTQRPPDAARARALHEAVVASPRTAAHPEVLHRLATASAPALTEGTEPMPTLAREIALAHAAHRGEYEGRSVADVGALATADDRALALLAIHLPSPSGQTLARRERIRRRVVASAFSEVRDDPEDVTQRVLETGRNAVALEAHPVRRMWLVEEAAPFSLLLRQDPHHGTVSLLAQGAQVVPGLHLRGRLWLEAADITQPITLCDAPAAEDPTPCLSPKDVALAKGVHATLREGALVFPEHVAIDDAIEWLGTAGKMGFPITLRVAEQAAALTLPVVFEPPPPLIFGGAYAKVDLTAQLEERTGHFIVQVSDGTAARKAIVPIAGAAYFHVTTRGARGSDGTNGSDGMDGASGMGGTPGSCSFGRAGDGTRGHDGGHGSRGGRGDDGGPGGDVVVSVRCEPARCAVLEERARVLFRSEGGSGGAGGRGGRGGRGGAGGRGGDGATCTQDGKTHTTRSGSSGPRGSDGTSGSDGWAGSDGRPGHVTVRVAAQR